MTPNFGKRGAMSEQHHVQQTLDLVIAQLQVLEKQAAEKKRTANDLCRLLNVPPMFQDIESVASGMTTLADEYYGRQLPEVIRTILEKRKRANLGSATVAEIYDAMVSGGYHFQAQNAEYAKRGIYGVLAAGDEFHKLPNGGYGLSSWYPAAKMRVDREDAKTKRNPKRARLQKKIVPSRSPAKRNTNTTVMAGSAPSGAASHESSNGSVAFGKGDLLKLVREIVQSYQKSFTSLDVLERLRERLGGEVKQASAKAVLSRLVEGGEVEIVKQGSGRRPNVFKRKSAAV
jgi:hypothetical protein